MNKSIIILSTCFAGIFFQACDKEAIELSTEVVTKEDDFKDFTSIDIANDFEVYVNFSDEEEKISIEANDNLMEHVRVEMNNGKLEIRLNRNLNIRGNETIKAYVTTAMINTYKASDDAEIYLQDELVTDNVSMELSGDSKLEGALETTTLNANLSDDSYLDLIGTTDNLEINLSGDSEIKRYDFSVKNLKIDLASDSKGYLGVLKLLI